jgi:hypothetical protein
MKSLNAAPKAQFFTAAGTPLVGGKLYTYVGGTSAPQATYTTEAGATANTNPIILDSRGECNLFLTQSVSYKFILYDSTDVLIWSVDNVSSVSGMATQSASAVAITGGTISGVTISGGTISGLTSPLPIASGGTNAITAAAARTALSAAASGANSDITSLTGLTTPLSVAQGGTGAATHTANSILIGNGTSAVTSVAPGTSGNLLASDGTSWASTAPAAAGVTSAVAGSGITVSAATGAVTISQDFYTDSTSTNVTYPIGSYVIVNLSVSTYANNSSQDVRNATGNTAFAIASGTALTGTWRARGSFYQNFGLLGCTNVIVGYALFQRTA